MVAGFVAGATAGFCDELHIEERLLFFQRMTLIAVLVEPRTLLIKNEEAAEIDRCGTRVQEVLERHDLKLVDGDTALGDIAAIQLAGIRGSTWDLWGRDRSSALQALRSTVAGDDLEPSAPGIAPDMAVGMTLEELIDRKPPGG